MQSPLPSANTALPCSGLRATMFSPATPAAIKARQASGRDADLKDVLKVRSGWA